MVIVPDSYETTTLRCDYIAITLSAHPFCPSNIFVILSLDTEQLFDIWLEMARSIMAICLITDQRLRL